MGKLDQDEALHRSRVRREIAEMVSGLRMRSMMPDEMLRAIRQSAMYAENQQAATIAANRLIDCLMLEDS